MTMVTAVQAVEYKNHAIIYTKSASCMVCSLHCELVTCKNDTWVFVVFFLIGVYLCVHACNYKSLHQKSMSGALEL